MVLDHDDGGAAPAELDEDLGEAAHVGAAGARGRLVEQQRARARAVGQRDREQALDAVRDVGGPLAVVLAADPERLEEPRPPPPPPAVAWPPRATAPGCW